MTRWKITLEYDGSGFCGWQRQENGYSVQQAVEEAIQNFSQETAAVFAAGRTDAGVHALAQIAHFDLVKETDGDTVRDALNHFLREKPVAVINAEKAADDFHARFSAIRRHYLYRVINRRAPLALESGKALHVIKPLALKPMQEAAAKLQGLHDFSTFRAANCQAKSPLKTLEEARVEQNGDAFTFHFAARSFLYHQVRNMAGTLLLTGTGQWNLDDFTKAFAAHDRKAGGPAAAADGLYFVSADY